MVIDASDPRRPRWTTSLDDPVMIDPHETLKHNDRRKLLAGARTMGRGLSFMTPPLTVPTRS